MQISSLFSSASAIARKSALLGVPLALAMVASGCTNSRDYDPVVDDRFEQQGNFANFTESNIRIGSGHLSGDIGDLTALDESALVNGSHDANFTLLEVVVQSDRGSAMNLLQFYGGVDHDQLAPGSRLSFDLDSPDYSGDAVFVDGIACSGPGAPGAWDYDESLDSVEVEVEAGEDDNSRRLHFTTLASGQEATGYVDVQILD